jgi:hypothetical protein
MAQKPGRDDCAWVGWRMGCRLAMSLGSQRCRFLFLSVCLDRDGLAGAEAALDLTLSVELVIRESFCSAECWRMAVEERVASPALL